MRFDFATPSRLHASFVAALVVVALAVGNAAALAALLPPLR